MRLLLVIGALMTSCEGSKQHEPIHLRLAVVGALEPLGPRSGKSATVIAQDWVFQPLLGVAADGSLAPALASRFERLQDGSYRFQVREKAAFSDGSPVTEGDIVRSLGVVPGGPGLHIRRSGDWLTVSSDDHRTAVEAALTRRTVFKEEPPNGAIGTGPFVLVEQSPKRLLLKRLGGTAANRVTSVELIAAENPSDAFAMTLAGAADVLPEVPSRVVEFFEGVARLRVVRAPSPQALGLMLNTGAVDRATRVAIAAALPFSDIPEIAAREGCRPLPAPKSAADHSLPDGPPLRIVGLLQDSKGQRLARGVRRWLGTRAGALDIVDIGAIVRKLAARQTDALELIMMPILVAPLGMQAWIFRTGSPENHFRYSNPAFDAAADAGDWSRAAIALASDPPFIAICRPERVAVVDARFRNAQVGPYGLLETLPDWEATP